jgi:Bacterial Ig-like domain
MEHPSVCRFYCGEIAVPFFTANHSLILSVGSHEGRDGRPCPEERKEAAMSKSDCRSPRARTLRFCQADELEDRVLMSAGLSLAQMSGEQSVSISAPTYVSQKVDSLEVTLNRAASAGPDSLTGVPLTVNFSASLGSKAPGGQTVALPASASGTFTAVNESVTFPVGVAVETVQIPIHASATSPGSVPIDLSASYTANGAQTASSVVDLVSGPSALPPTPVGMIGAHEITQGKTVSGIAITFSGSMDPATVENIHNYKVKQAAPSLTLNDFWKPSTYAASSTVALKSAQYDPATNTVTLIPQKPLKSSVVYTIENPTPAGKHTLTDSQGNAALGNFASPAGLFYFTLKGAERLTWSPPQAPTIYGGS